MTHSEMDELYELFVLGALEAEPATEIESHLADGCEHCLAQVRQAVGTAAGLSVLAEQVTPPAHIRERLLASLASEPKPESLKPKRSWSWAIPAFAFACAALVGVLLWSNERVTALQTRLEHVLAERDQLRSALSVLVRSDTRTVQFGNSNQTAHGRVLVNPNGGFVFVGSDLPTLADDRTFELWLVPAKGAPEPAGLFRAGQTGSFVHVSQQSVDPSRVAAVAVSVEPRSGSTAPTTKPFLIVPLS